MEERELAFGHNRKPKQVLKTLYALFVESMDDFTLKILIVAAFISISCVSNFSRGDDHQRGAPQHRLDRGIRDSGGSADLQSAHHGQQLPETEAVRTA